MKSLAVLRRQGKEFPKDHAAENVRELKFTDDSHFKIAPVSLIPSSLIQRVLC